MPSDPIGLQLLLKDIGKTVMVRTKVPFTEWTVSIRKAKIVRLLLLAFCQTTRLVGFGSGIFPFSLNNHRQCLESFSYSWKLRLLFLYIHTFPLSVWNSSHGLWISWQLDVLMGT